MVNRFTLQNETLLDLDVQIFNEHAIDIRQISYEKNGKVKLHGQVILCKQALKSILKSLEESERP